jgi:phenylalanine ammonia-lyase
MQKHYHALLQALLKDELTTHLGQHFSDGIVPSTLQSQLVSTVLAALGPTSTADAERQLKTVASGMTSPILEFFSSINCTAQEHKIIHSVSSLRSSFARQGAEILQAVRLAFVTGKPLSLVRGHSPDAPAGPFIGRTKPVYEYIRKSLGIRMHGSEHMEKFTGPLGGEPSIGYYVSLIYEVSSSLMTS